MLAFALQQKQEVAGSNKSLRLLNIPDGSCSQIWDWPVFSFSSGKKVD
jgi:hypothetical protein